MSPLLTAEKGAANKQKDVALQKKKSYIKLIKPLPKIIVSTKVYVG